MAQVRQFAPAGVSFGQGQHERWNGRLTQAAAKYGENAPMAATCCNACRTRMQTNLIALALGSVIAAGEFVSRLVRRAAAVDPLRSM